MSTEENPFGIRVDNPDTDETGGDIEQHPMTTRSRSRLRGLHDTTDRHITYEETSFGGDASETEPLLGRMKSLDTGLKNIEDA